MIPILAGFLQELHIFIILAVLYAIVIRTLTPNLKRHGLSLGWLGAELTEHVGIPLVILATFAVCSWIWLPVYAVAMFALYGFGVGAIHTKADAVSVLLMTMIFVALLYLPEVIWYMDYVYGVTGWITWALVVLLFYIPLIVERIEKRRQVIAG